MTHTLTCIFSNSLDQLMQQLSFILTRNSPQKNNLGQLWIILSSSLQVSVIILIEKDKKKKTMLQPSASQSDSLVTSVESS